MIDLNPGWWAGKRKMTKENLQALIYNTLEHITNVTNVGLLLNEVENDLVISYPVKSSQSVRDSEYPKNHPKAELIFTRAEGNDLKVSHKFPVGTHGYQHEEVAAISAD